MKTYIPLLLTLLAASCVKDVGMRPDTEGVHADRVAVELFTRLDAPPFEVPVSRAAAIENDVDKNPWILVFKDNGSGIREQAVFFEAAQTFVTSAAKSYVLLTPQPADTKLWIIMLANPEDRFFIKNDGTGGTGYGYSVENFDDRLTGVNLADVAARLLAEPLSDGSPVGEVPFLNRKLPMSYVSPQSGFLAGISSTTSIGSSSVPLKLTRTVAKIVMKNTAPRFEMDGIVSVHGMNNLSQVCNHTGTLQPVAASVHYMPSDPNSDLIAKAADKSSDPDNTTDPIYVYEYAAGSSRPFIIIKGVYTHAGADARTYYYKAALVDDAGAYLDIRRNCSYEFTLRSVTGPGFTAFEDAVSSGPDNTPLNYTVTVIDENACEITANNQFYMGLSNRLCMIYNQGTSDEYIAFTVVTNCTTRYPNDNRISLSNDDLLEITAPSVLSGDSYPRVAIADNPNVPVATDIKVRLKTNDPGDPGNPHRTVVYIKLGPLEQKVEILRWPIVPAAGTVLQYYRFVPASADGPGYWYYDYYLSTGAIESASSGYGSAFRLSTTENHIFRDDTNRVTAEDGKIDIHIDGTSQRRNALVWLTTIKNPGFPSGDDEYMPRRIKVYIHQSAPMPTERY